MVVRQALFNADGPTKKKNRKRSSMADLADSVDLEVDTTQSASTSAADSALSDSPGPVADWVDEAETPSLRSPSITADQQTPHTSSSTVASPENNGGMIVDCTPSVSGLHNSASTVNTGVIVMDCTPSVSGLQNESQSSKNCDKCANSERKRKALKKKYDRLKKKFDTLEVTYNELLTQQIDEVEGEDIDEEREDADEERDDGDEEPEELEESQSDPVEEEEEETDWAALEESAEEYSSQSEDEEKEPSNTIRVEPGTPAHEEPKFIVFFTNLLAIFSLLCFKCKKGSPRVTMKQRGTMVMVIQDCSECGDGAFEWKSQPMALDGKHPAGNVLLSFAVLMAGASISKVLLVFKHMGLSTYSVRTYFAHQKNFLFPVVIGYWEKYQSALIAKLKLLKNVVWSGDGRFDSMGHSAKFGAYTMFCNTVLKVVHFEILQANETGSSTAMELEGAKRAFSYLQSAGLSIKVFISDRHRGIAKWIRECQTHCTHYFDIWHVAKSVTKSMIKFGKEKGCERICDWVKGARNHLYWCATSTIQGFPNLIAEKWKSFMQHVANIHDNFPSTEFKDFKKCAHNDQIEKRRWIKIGTKAYDKLKTLLTSVRLVNDIKNLSPDAQTSCLEGLHSTLNHWHPKMVCFSWLGTYCRHILASLHFNENVKRESKTSEDGEEYFKVTYPKFKLGEEVVRKIVVPPTYGYVQEIKESLFSVTSKAELKTVADKYNAKVPPSLTSQFPDRLKKPEAVKNFREREKRDVTQLYPSAEEQQHMQSSSATAEAPVTRKRRQPKCSKCRQPGHNASRCSNENTT